VADIDVGGAIASGFGLIRRKPLAVLAWGFVQALGLGGFFAAYAGFILTFIGGAATLPSGSQMTESQAYAMFGGMMMAEGGIFLAAMVMMIVRTIVWAAAMRAVLHPERDAWAYLRLGAAELFLVLLIFGLGFVANFAVLPLMPLMLVIGGLVLAHQWIAAIIVGVLTFVAMIAIVIYLELRFVLLAPMIIDDGKFHFLEAWRLSRGRVGRLFLVGLGVVGIVLATELVIYLLMVATGLGGLDMAAGGLDRLQGFFEQKPEVILGKLWPLAALWALCAVPVAGAVTAITIAPWARAYRDLAPAPT
jgi:hypothetical protein